MKKTTKYTLITAIIAVCVVAGLDIFLDWHDGSLTWSQWIQGKSLDSIFFTVIVATSTGLFGGLWLGHWLIPKRVYVDKIPQLTIATLERISKERDNAYKTMEQFAEQIEELRDTIRNLKNKPV